MNDFSLICRFCMKTKVSFYSIFETIFTEDDNKFAKILPKELQESILFCLGLTVSKDDQFPQQLCAECLPKILSFVRFKKQCLMTLEVLTNKRQTCKIENIDEIKTETIVDEPSKICEVNIDETGHWNNDDTTNSSDGTPRTKHVSSCKLIKRSPKQHTISTLKQDLHKCPHCEKEFTKKGNLNRHIQIHLDVRRHKCSLCPKRFIDKPSLKSHLVAHMSEQNFLCDVCGQSFDRRYSLQLHEKMHTQHRQFECDLCGKVFQQKSGITKHMVCHTDERPYECNICSKRFNTASNLNAHFRVHTKEKPYKCIQCNEAFPYRLSLVKHLQTHNLMATPNVPLTKATLKLTEYPMVEMEYE